MPNAARNRGARAEREIATKLANLTGLPIERRLQEGRTGDTGDLQGAPGWCLQVKNYVDVLRAIREGLPELEQQQTRAGATYGALLVRRRGGAWVAVIQTNVLARLIREAPPW